ncbi:hypothetical protein [Bordetella sp. N]|uniref:hypothetical protein n=1 Tax=Bordetella sp. N TaxID=1746199 RepID=UPI0012E38EE8|nr:hypothetical protein [Bordetella sp. N]
MKFTFKVCLNKSALMKAGSACTLMGQGAPKHPPDDAESAPDWGFFIPNDRPAHTFAYNSLLTLTGGIAYAG